MHVVSDHHGIFPQQNRRRCRPIRMSMSVNKSILFNINKNRIFFLINYNLLQKHFRLIDCGAGCATCNNKQTCDTCMAGYTKSFTTTACTGKFMTYEYMTQPQCYTVGCTVSQCADCGDNKNLCFKCNKGYFLNAKKDLCTSK